MDGRLKNAAAQGNIKELYELIRQNPKVLDDIDEVPFIETPLHVAASVGNISFAMEIVRLKPSFTRKLNEDGSSPMHMALSKGKKKMVLRFVEYESDLVRVQGSEGKTLLHYVAEKEEEEEVDLLRKFLWACPASIQDVTIYGETALHIAVKKEKYNALKVLVRRLLIACSYIQEEVTINRKDVDGNTALHIAVANHQEQAVRILLSSRLLDVNAKDVQGKTALHIAIAADQFQVVRLLAWNGIDVNAKDDEGKTALHFLNPQNSRQVEEILRPCAKAINRCLRCFSNRYINGHMLCPMSDVVSRTERFQAWIFVSKRNMDYDTRNVILVVATLILTATYQASLSPPGGLWQENSNSNGTSASESSETHRAGSTIMSNDNFVLYYLINSLTLLASTLVIFFLLPRDQMRWLLIIPLYCFSGCYNISWRMISPPHLRLYVDIIWLLVYFYACFFLFLLSKHSSKFDLTTTSR